MDKQTDARGAKKGDQHDSKKPGTIVAGPDAHAHEGAGQAPAGRGGKAEGEPAKKSTKGH